MPAFPVDSRYEAHHGRVLCMISCIYVLRTIDCMMQMECPILWFSVTLERTRSKSALLRGSVFRQAPETCSQLALWKPLPVAWQSLSKRVNECEKHFSRKEYDLLTWCLSHSLGQSHVPYADVPCYRISITCPRVASAHGTRWTSNSIVESLETVHAAWAQNR